MSFDFAAGLLTGVGISVLVAVIWAGIADGVMEYRRSRRGWQA